jgi:asparaginyl-tRNA synthetase
MTQEAQAPAPIIAIEQAGQHVGQSVTIRGWLYNQRESGKLLFPIFRDGTGVMQGVLSLKEHPEAFAAMKGMTQESSIIAIGKIQAEPRTPASDWAWSARLRGFAERSTFGR